MSSSIYVLLGFALFELVRAAFVPVDPRLVLLAGLVVMAVVMETIAVRRYQRLIRDAVEDVRVTVKKAPHA